MLFVIVLNVALWLYIGMLVVRSRRVEVECIMRYKIVLSVIFLLYGVVQYMAYIHPLTLISLLSFTALAILYYILPSGLAKDEIVITGKAYQYTKMRNVSVYDEKQALTIEFEYNRRTYFLYAKMEDEERIRKYLKKHCKRF